MTSRLVQLPDEVIQVILSHLPPLGNIALQQTCRHFANVGNESLLWRKYCQDNFKWWDRKNQFTARLQDASFTAWKELFASRHKNSQATRKAVANIVAEEVGRLDSLKVILDAGYDAKQDLLDMFWNSASSQSHLAQR